MPTTLANTLTYCHMSALFRTVRLCTSRYLTRSFRTRAAVEYTVPLDEDESGHNLRPPKSGFVKLSKRDWKAQSRNPISVIQSSDQWDPESYGVRDETTHSGFLRKKVKRNPTPSKALVHRQAMKEAFPEGWSPPHKLSRDAMEGLRILHTHDPQTFSTSVLAAKFKISPEAVRRILKSKWAPTPEEKVRLLKREMRDREEWIRARRVSEWKEMKDLEQNRVREDLAKGKVIGRNAKDSFSLV